MADPIEERAYVRTPDMPDAVRPFTGTELAEVWQGDAETGKMVKVPYNELQGNPIAHKLTHELNGTDQLGSNNPSPNVHVISSGTGKVDTWVSDGSETVKGKVQFATDGESAANKAMQSNDVRGRNARPPTVHGSTHSSAGDDPIEGLPTIGQAQAMAGTYGSPDENNKFVTDTDPRLSGQIITIISGTTYDILDGSSNGERKTIINTTAEWILLTTEQESGYILPYNTLELMWFVDCWYAIDGKMVGEVLNVTFPIDKVPYGYLTLHSGLRPSRTAYSRLFKMLTGTLTDVTFTCTTATPTIITSTAHGFVGGERLRLFTDGALTGATLTNDYFVEYINATTFYLNTLEGGTARLAITAQSGTHYYQCSAYGVGDGSTTFDIPDPRQVAFVGAGTGTTHNIASVDTYLGGQFKDDRIQNITGSLFVDSPYTTSTGAFVGVILGGGGANLERDKTVSYSFDASRVARAGNTTRTKQLGTYYIIKY